MNATLSLRADPLEAMQRQRCVRQDERQKFHPALDGGLPPAHVKFVVREVDDEEQGGGSANKPEIWGV